jgi:hypothetical protein
LKIEEVWRKKYLSFKKFLGGTLFKLLLLSTIFSILFLIGCNEDLVQPKPSQKIVVDEFSAIANVQFRGNEKETKIDYLIRYHFVDGCGSIEKILFKVKNYIKTTNYRQSEPTPIGTIATEDSWFWIADTLDSIDSVTLSCTMNGTFYTPINCSDIIDSLEWNDSIFVAIQR